MLTAIVTTTINPPNFLEAYVQNFTKFDVNPDEVFFLVVGDNKTPPGYENISNFEGLKDSFDHRELPLGAGLKYSVEYWNPKDQEWWIKDNFSQDSKEIERLIIPHNDPRRRNFGFLRAHEIGADVIITIDDDNLPQPNSNWLGEHLKGLESSYRLKVHSLNGIVNPCRLLHINEPYVYSRGYPISEFFSDNVLVYELESKKQTILNMGLWTEKPDVDSFTNLVYPNLHSSGQKFPFTYFGVEKDNYFPINTQNTAFKKELSIFHNLYMDPSFIHRYDDIWMGLFAQKLANKFGDITSFGLPLVMHKRNTHNYQDDLWAEFIGIGMNSKMWKEVKDMDISSKNYTDGFLEIADKLPKFQNPEVNKFLRTMKESMRLWVELVGVIE